MDRALLKDLRHLDPRIDQLYRYLRLTHVTGLPLMAGENDGADGRLHPAFAVNGTASGRVTAAAPAVLSLPAMLRPIIVADDPDSVIVEIDVSQQDVAVAAAEFGIWSDSRALLDLVNSGDAYVSAAPLLFPGRTDMRPAAKRAFLSVMNGAGAEGLARQLGVSPKRARRVLDQLKRSFPEVGAAHTALPDLLRVRGFAVGRAGLRRYRGTEGRLTPWERRWAINHVVQAGGAAAMLSCISRVHAYLEGVGGRLLFPVYDSLVVQVPRRNCSEITRGIQQRLGEGFCSLYPELKMTFRASAPSPCWGGAA